MAETNNGDLWERTNTPFPNFLPGESGGLPSLPQLQSIDDYTKQAPIFGQGGQVDKWLGSHIPGWSAATGTADAVSTAFNIVTNPSRVITVVVGLILIAGGLYLLSQSTLVDAVKQAVKS